MKTLFKLLVVQATCLSLFAADALARGFGGGGGRSSGGGRGASASRGSYSRSAPSRSSSSRPVSRPSSANRSSGSYNRSPVTSSRVSRPSTKQATRPSTQPSTRPSTRPSTPTTLPSRPATRPSTKPGNVTYPKADRPMTLPADRPGTGATRPSTLPATRPGAGNRPGISQPIQRPGQNTRPIQRPDFGRPSQRPGDRPGIGDRPGAGGRPGIGDRPGGGDNWWNEGRPNRPGFGDDTIIHIDNNFQNNWNWSTNRNNWGYHPWWNQTGRLPWYGGSWSCGWRAGYIHGYAHGYHDGYYYGGYRPWPGYVVYHDDDDLAEAIGWGLAAWGLGNLIFNSGYQSYSNPYPAQPVATASGPPVTYQQPITIVATETAPKDEAAATAMAEKSTSLIEQSQAAFRDKNYLVALEAATKAVGEAPGDGALHEYRALVLFALGKFSEAAGVLNPILASGPGWDWTTMVRLYDSQTTYTGQLRALEDYVIAKPTAADARFLLGYHYMVCGHLELAAAQFAEAAKLQPADTVSRQLAELAKASTRQAEPAPGGQPAPKQPAQQPPSGAPAPEPVPLEKLAGTWVSDKGDQGTVTLALKDGGKFAWTFTKAGKSNEFGGDYSMNDNGLLVLDAEDSQMVATVELPKDDQMKFVLAGGPPGDPGLQFARK